MLNRSFSSSDSEFEQFGYRKVRRGEKEGMVRGVFSNVADNYDIMNDLMSGGMHRLWKDAFVKAIGIPAMVAARKQQEEPGAAAPADQAPLRFLDVAGGTGDISFRIVDAIDKAGGFVGLQGGGAEGNGGGGPSPVEKEVEQKLEGAPEARGGEAAPKTNAAKATLDGGPVSDGETPFPPPRRNPTAVMTMSDINPEMLGVGEARARQRYGGTTTGAAAGNTAAASWTRANQPLIEHMAFQVANAQALPFEDDSFDVYTIAFGLRNVTDVDAALREARRVLKPGGRFLCLEFSHIPPSLGPLGPLYDAYSFALIPAMGQLVANDRASYQYLVESIRLFPKQEALEAKLAAAGFSHTAYRNYTAGVVAVHSGFKF